uniref:AI-2E family transporter n=1 Tax=Anaerococcus mediterraneensis TaxID=1870984 RepID=UPI000931A409|nr:AI-2E family transporter [Anaerococcus mediterraneensis]
MKELDTRSKNLLKVVIIGILLYFGFFYIANVMKALGKLYTIIQPFILGGALAFIISIPMNFFEKKLRKFLPDQKKEKLRNILALLLSWLILIIFLVILIYILVPAVIKIINTFSNKWPYFVNEIHEILNKYPLTEPLAEKFMETFEDVDWYSMRNAAISFLKGNNVDIFSRATSLINSVSSGLIGIFTMFVFSIFVLLYKKMLKTNGTRILYAVFKEETADYINKVFSLSYNTFKDYLYSRLISVVCLSTLTFIGMFILRIPNAVMISVLVGLSDLIPIFGPIFGAGFSAVLIFIESPFKALVFIIYDVIIQQIQENIVYPAIAGDRVGLPAVWVMASVTIGGAAFGIWGMLVSIPVVSVIYTLVHEKIHKVLEEKDISEEMIIAKRDKTYKIKDIEVDDEA